MLSTLAAHSMRSRVYETQAFVRLSVCLSVPLFFSPHAAAVGLLLSAVLAGDIDRQRRRPRR